jgi:UDPglucose--hexose-1-phosphate uridylyltransferase
VVFAAGRGARPGAWLPELEPPTDEELDRCPFCAGREERTPPETLRIGDPWRVRVVPNLYPAFERQEVVIHSPDHVRSFADLDDGQVLLVAEAWERRRADVPEGELLAFVNEGRLAGASLPHTHSQLVWLSEPPPAVTGEVPGRIAELLGLEVMRRGEVIAAVHPTGAGPYESVIAARDGGGELADGLLLLRDLIRRLHAAEGVRPWNAWLHPGPPWHVHVVPRLTALAGVELGAGVYVNVLPPELAAERLRSTG